MRTHHVVAFLIALLAATTALRSHELQNTPPVCDEFARTTKERGEQLLYVKTDNVLCLLDGQTVRWARSASHGRAQGKKTSEGDARTPEGRYTVSPARKSRRFGLFLAISYPNAADLRAARALGKRPGSAVGIHGPQSWYAWLGEAQSLINHSDGCIVVDETAIRELAALITKPVPIDILPERS